LDFASDFDYVDLACWWVVERHNQQVLVQVLLKETTAAAQSSRKHFISCGSIADCVPHMVVRSNDSWKIFTGVSAGISYSE